MATKLRADAPDLAERVSVVGPERAFDVGVPVRAVGELHAMIHPEIPRLTNSGYLLTLGDSTSTTPATR